MRVAVAEWLWQLAADLRFGAQTRHNKQQLLTKALPQKMISSQDS